MTTSSLAKGIQGSWDLVLRCLLWQDFSGSETRKWNQMNHFSMILWEQEERWLSQIRKKFCEIFFYKFFVSRKKCWFWVLGRRKKKRNKNGCTPFSVSAAPCPPRDPLWLKQWTESTEHKNKQRREPVECDGLCYVGQTAGSVPSSAGEPSQGPHSIFATLLKEQDVMPGREVLLAWLVPLSCRSLGLSCIPSEM